MNAEDLARIQTLIRESRRRIAASSVAVEHSQKHVAQMRESIYRDHLRIAWFLERLARWQEQGE